MQNQADEQAATASLSPASGRVPTPGAEPYPDYYVLPTPSLLLTLVKRNIFVIAIIAVIGAPLAFVAVKRASKTYASSVVIKFDASDSLDPENALGIQPNFVAVLTFMTETMKGLEFYEELAGLYQPTEREGLFSQYELRPELAKYVDKPADDTPSPQALEAKAKGLAKQVSLASEYEMQRSNIAVLTSQAETATDAQRLVGLTGRLLIDQFFKMEAKRAGMAQKSLSNLLENTKVKNMAERAAASVLSRRPKDRGKPTAIEREHLDLTVRSHETQEQIKELTARITSIREQKSKLEAQASDLAQRYGRFHPQIQSIASQVAELDRTLREGGLLRELQRLQADFLRYESEANALGLTALNDLEGVDKIVQKLTTKLDRYTLEQVNLELQLSQPSQRLRLSIVGAPLLPLEPLSSKKVKTAAMSLAFIAFMIVAAVTVREFLSGRARDPWAISWRFQVRCIAQFSSALHQLPSWLEPKTIRSLDANLHTKGSKSKKPPLLFAYREFTHWLRTESRGNIVLIVKGSEQSNCGSLINNIVNVYSSDYAGRCLVLDFDASDPIATPETKLAEGNVVDYLTRDRSWREVSQPKDAYRNYDLVPAPATADQRLAELVSSDRLSQFLANASKYYSKIFLVGLGAQHFIVNSSLLDHATDCVMVIEGSTAKYRTVNTLISHLEASKLGGYVFVGSA